MSETFKIKVPTELSGIKLKEYQKYIKTVQTDPDKQPTDEQVEFANLKVLECFCGLTLKQAYKLLTPTKRSIFNSIKYPISTIGNEKNNERNNGIRKRAKGIKNLNVSSNVNEKVIQ